jgi:hypothetical protein
VLKKESGSINPTLFNISLLIVYLRGVPGVEISEIIQEKACKNGLASIISTTS